MYIRFYWFESVRILFVGCQMSIGNGWDCGPFWYIRVTPNQGVKGVDEGIFCKSKCPTDYSRIVCSQMPDTVPQKDVAIRRILLSIAGCSIVLETQQPRSRKGSEVYQTRRSRKRIEVRGDECDGLLLRRDSFEILPNEICEVYIREGPTRCETSIPKTKTFMEKLSFVIL